MRQARPFDALLVLGARLIELGPSLSQGGALAELVERERRVYTSMLQGQEVQELVVLALRHFTCRVLQDGEDTQVQELMAVVAGVLEAVPEDRTLSFLDHIGQVETGVERMTLRTVQLVCNALDHARRGGFTDIEDQQGRHRYVDMIAEDFLSILRRRQDLSAAEFEWTVHRAGLRLVGGDVRSRYAIERPGV